MKQQRSVFIVWTLSVIFGLTIAGYGIYQSKVFASIPQEDPRVILKKASRNTMKQKAAKLKIKKYDAKPSRRLISNEEFTNQNWTEDQVIKFYRSWKYNRFTTYEIKQICKAARKNRIHPLAQATKMEQENSLVRNLCSYARATYKKRRFRAMAYGLSWKKKINGKTVYTHGGFYRQVSRGTKCLRKWFDHWTTGKKIKVNFNRQIVTPKNAATYSLYVYCPFYGGYLNYGKPCLGNIIFEDIYAKFKARWDKLNG